MTNVFISHTHADTKFARKLANDLKDQGLTVRSDAQLLQPGDRWANVIGKAIRDADRLENLVHPACRTQANVTSEGHPGTRTQG